AQEGRQALGVRQMHGGQPAIDPFGKGAGRIEEGGAVAAVEEDITEAWMAYQHSARRKADRSPAAIPARQARGRAAMPDAKRDDFSRHSHASRLKASPAGCRTGRFARR